MTRCQGDCRGLTFRRTEASSANAFRSRAASSNAACSSSARGHSSRAMTRPVPRTAGTPIATPWTPYSPSRTTEQGTTRGREPINACTSSTVAPAGPNAVPPFAAMMRVLTSRSCRVISSLSFAESVGRRPLTLARLNTGTTRSPCSPRTAAEILTEGTFRRSARIIRNRCESRRVPEPSTRVRGHPVDCHATVVMTSIGFVKTTRLARRAARAMSRLSSATSPAFACRRSSRVISGFRPCPADKTTTSQSARSSILPTRTAGWVDTRRPWRMSSACAQARSGTASTRISSSHGPSRARAKPTAPPTFPTPTIPAFMTLPIKGLAVHKHSLPVPRRRDRLPGEKLVHDAVRLLPFGALLEDVDRSDLRDVLQMRAAARAVVRTPDFDHPKGPHGLRDEIQEGSIVDFVFPGDTVFLEDSDRLRRGDDSVAVVLDPLQILRREVRGLEVHAAVVHVNLVADGPRPVGSEHEPRHQVLGGVHPHVLVPSIPIDHAMDPIRRWHPIDVVLHHALLLRDPKDACLTILPAESPGVVGLPASFCIEEGLVEDDEIRTTLQNPGVELSRVARVRFLSPPFLHVENPRGHRPGERRRAIKRSPRPGSSGLRTRCVLRRQREWKRTPFSGFGIVHISPQA